MRQITKDATNAFDWDQPFNQSNTTVRVETDGFTKLYLFNNMIAYKRTGHYNSDVSITLAGWPSATTRERLNGLDGVRLYQSKGEQFLNDNIIDDDKWYVINQE